VYESAGFKLNFVSADAPPPDAPADVLKPPAPPPPDGVLAAPDEPPPPAITKKSAVTDCNPVHPKAANAAAPILDKRGIFYPYANFVWDANTTYVALPVF
jgi:hypothetical protein